MKKLVLFLVIISMMGTIMVGCESDKQVEPTVSAEEVMNQIKNQISEELKAQGVEEPIVDGSLKMYMEADLAMAENETGFEAFGITPDLLESGVLLQNMMNVNSNLIIVLKAKDDASVAQLEEGLGKVKENQNNIWSQYLPDQYEKVNNNITKTDGKYLLYTTYDNPQEIEKVFDNTLHPTNKK